MTPNAPRALLALLVLVVGALALSQTAHAEDPWAVTLGGVQSDGCSQGFSYSANESQLHLDLTDPLSPTLTIESLFSSEYGSFVDGEHTLNGPNWGRRAATFKGTLTGVDLDQKTWTFALQSEKLWTLKSPPSPIDPPLPPPDTTNTPTNPDPAFTLACAHETLPLTDGPEIIALQCDLVTKSSLAGLLLVGFRDYESADYHQRLYFRQGGPLAGFSSNAKATWQEAPVGKLVWGE